jgi:hypothetical protein
METMARSELSPWRDFTEEEQRLMLRLLRMVKDLRGARFEVTMLRNGQLQVARVGRQVVLEVPTV